MVRDDLDRDDPATAASDAAAADPEGLAGRIRTARRERGLTQEGLAQAVGVSRSAVAQWETGRAGQISGNLTRVAQALGVGVEWLLYGNAKHESALAVTGDEWAMLRLYRACGPADRQLLLRTARRLAAAAETG